MITPTASRVAGRGSRLGLFGIAALLWSSSIGLAEPIIIEWAEPYAGKSLSIESGLETLYEEELQGGSLTLQSDTMLAEDNVSLAAVVNVEGHDELAIDINLFRCVNPCKWRLALTLLEEGNSRSVNRICQNSPVNVAGRFNKYFFCRKAYRGFMAAGGSCWSETKAALTGWFDAAYNLHALTLKDGIGFVARDTVAEDEVEQALANCPGFEKSVRRNDGYFGGMIKNLDKAVLEQAQRVERLKADNREVEAQSFAEKMVEQLQSAAPLRDLISAKDAEYVESVLNHALGRGELFHLR